MTDDVLITTHRTPDAHERADDACPVRYNRSHRPVVVEYTRAQVQRLWRHAYGIERLPDDELCALLRYTLPEWLP